MKGKKVLAMLLAVAMLFPSYPTSTEVYAQRNVEEITVQPEATVETELQGKEENQKTAQENPSGQSMETVTENQTENEETEEEVPQIQVYEPKIIEGPGPYYELDMEVEKAYIPFDGRVRLGALPSSYDSRNYNLIPEVRNQNPFGTCWTFSSMAAAEAGMISQGEIIDGKVADTSIDLSEYQLARFQYFTVDDPLKNTTGDKTAILFHGAELTGREAVRSDNSYLNTGGNVLLAMWNMAGWKAGAKEEKAPYSSIETTAGVLSDNVAFDNIAHMENAYIISMDQPQMVKSMILGYGALACSYKSGDESYTITTETNGKVNARYFSGTRSVNGANASSYGGHAIALVGWDDNYAVTNFPSGCRPSAPGAWLVRNSWGSSWGDDGYFWIPYEEITLNEEAVALDFSPAEKYDYNYQYDGSSNNYNFSFNAAINYANVFQVKGEEEQILDAVGFGVNSSNVDYELQVYIDPTEGDPDSGTPLFETPQTGTLIYPGYHTIPLKHLAILKPGQSFAVVFKVDSDKKVFYDATQDNGIFRFVNQTQANQSMCYTGSFYCDFHNPSVSLPKGSVRIKAYTVDAKKQEVIITKADPHNDGRIEKRYRSQILSRETILSPTTVELSNTELSFNGFVQVPQITAVKDKEGNVIDASNYTVEVETENPTAPGTYQLTVRFQGNYYTGSITKEYKILKPEIADYTPQGLRASGNGKNEITLSWNPYEQGNGYRIYQAESLTGDYHQIAEISDSNRISYEVTSLEEGKSYYFRISSYKNFSNHKYESLLSESLKANTLEITEIKKAAPGRTGSKKTYLDGVEIESVSIHAPSEIRLSQTSFIGNGAVQAPTITGVYDEVGNVVSAENYHISYQNQNSSEIGTYQITVEFQGDFYEGILEATYEIQKHEITSKTPSGLTQQGDRDGAVTLSWEKDQQADGYLVYQSDTENGVYRLISQLEGNENNTYTVPNLENGRSYYFKIKYFVTYGSKTYNSDFSLPLKASTDTVTKITKASPEGNGAVEEWMDGAVFSSRVIYAPAEIVLSSVEFTANGSVQKPEITGVYDAQREMISETDYKVSLENENSVHPGIYRVTVEFQGDYYQGSLTKEYKITEPDMNHAIPKELRQTKGEETVIEITWQQTKEADGYFVYQCETQDGEYQQVADLIEIESLFPQEEQQGDTEQKNVVYRAEGLLQGKSYYFKIKSYQTLAGRIYESPQTEVLKASTTNLVEITKASPEANGKIDEIMDGEIVNSREIYAPAEIILSESQFTENGIVQMPEVTCVYDTQGEAISETDYEVSFQEENAVNPGMYQVTVEFQGDYYQGSLTTEYEILELDMTGFVPEELQQTAITENSLVITWNQIQEAHGYLVYQSDTVDGEYLPIADINSAYVDDPFDPDDGEYLQIEKMENTNKVYYQVDGLSKGRSYYFKVSSYKKLAEKVCESPKSEVFKGNTTPFTEITKASPEANGKIEELLDGEIFSSREIYAPVEVRLTETEFIADGMVQIPEVVGVYDTQGEAISETDYDVSLENENSTEAGTYQVVVELKGEYYQGTLTTTYQILVPVEPEEPKDPVNPDDTEEPKDQGTQGNSEKPQTPNVSEKPGTSKLPNNPSTQIKPGQNVNAGSTSNTEKEEQNQWEENQETPSEPIKPGMKIVSGIYEFKIKNKTEAIFTGVAKSIQKVKIANTVTYQGKILRVTAIAAKALKNDKVVKKISVGAYVKTIGASAFEGCSQLKTVSLGKQVIVIDKKALKNCGKLKKVTIPKTVTTIKKSVFEGCAKLSAITIQSTKLKMVQKNVFKGISKKAKIKVPKKSLKTYKKLLKNKGQSKSVAISGK